MKMDKITAVLRTRNSRIGLVVAILATFTTSSLTFGVYKTVAWLVAGAIGFIFLATGVEMLFLAVFLIYTLVSYVISWVRSGEIT